MAPRQNLKKTLEIRLQAVVFVPWELTSALMSLCILLYTRLNTLSCILFPTSAASQKQQRTLFVAALGEVFTDFSSFSSHRGANFLSLTPGRRTVTGPLILTEKPLIQLQENMFLFSSTLSYKRLISAAGLLFVDTQRHRLATVRHNSRDGQALSLFSLLFLFLLLLLMYAYIDILYAETISVDFI